MRSGEPDTVRATPTKSRGGGAGDPSIRPVPPSDSIARTFELRSRSARCATFTPTHAPDSLGIMTSPPHDAALVRQATDRLLASVAELRETDLGAPSLLPEWTRGHVLAHLARNADALANVLAGRPMYPDDRARDAAIERDAARAPAAHVEDLRTSSARLDAAFAALPEPEWQRTVELRGGLTDRLASLPFRRWTEIELHRVDLGVGYGLDDLPAEFTTRALDAMAQRFSGHPGVTEAIELRPHNPPASGAGGAAGNSGGAHASTESARLRTGALEGAPVVISGTPASLLGWLTGRTRGDGLVARGSLPALPPL